MTNTGTPLGERSLADVKRELLVRLLEAEGVGAAASAAIPRQDAADGPQSFAQELLWMLDRAAPGLTAYNAPLARRIRGKIDLGALQGALDAVVARHESLRTVFETVDGRASQRIVPPTRTPLDVVDLRAGSAAEREGEATRALRAASAHAFDLTRDVMLRATVVTLADDEHVLLLLSHHIAVDGWSMRILVGELAQAYDSARRGTTLDAPATPLRYLDYAAWQREQLAGERMTALLDYWKGQLADVEPLALPTDRPRPSVPSFAGVQRVAMLPASLVEAMRRVGQREGATLYMVLLAAYQTLLQRYSGQDDIVVGSPVAGRTRRETESLVGYFVNALPMRTRFHGDPTFSELLGRVRETALGAYDHQEIPLERLVLEMGRDRALSHAPLFQAFLTMGDGAPPEFRPAGITDADVDIDALHDGSSKFDVLLLATEQPDGLRLLLQARRDLFDDATIERALGHLRTLIESAVADPSQPVSALPLLTGSERDALLALGGEGRAAGTETVPARIAAAAERGATALAVVAADATLTYADLLARADAVADALHERGVRAGDMVGLALERSAAAVAGMLGIWRAGAAYVPLAPDLPAARLARLVEQAQIRVAVVGADAAAMLPAAVQAVSLAGAMPIATRRAAQSTGWPSPDDAAYVLFTSGSTGEPKGVVVTHGNLAAYTRAVSERLLAADGGTPRRFGWMSTVAADLGNTAVFPALVTGACLHVVAPDVATDAARFGEYAAANALDVLKLTPSHLRALLGGPAGADAVPRGWVVLGGEPLPWELADELLRAGRCRVLNHYGPTETTVGACALEVTRDVVEALRPRAGTVPVGRALAHATAHVLDARGALVPLGVPGELWIGGAAVARGYLGRDDLTQERFTPDPLSTATGARRYRTGDRVRRLPSGEIEFLGRLDGQVKVRGYRIELGEVEAVLAAQPFVAHAAAVVASRDGEAQLIGFVVPTHSAAYDSTLEQSLLDVLAAQLPAYMVPSRIVRLQSLLLTPNGKLDRRALVTLAGETGTAASEADAEAFVAPRTETETAVARIWAEVLKKERVGVTENFFALGGHSLSAIRVLGKLSREFKQRLPLRAIFEAPTVAALSLVIERAGVVTQAEQ